MGLFIGDADADDDSCDDPPVLCVDLLGGFRIRVGGVELTATWRSRKAASLVKLLALEPGHAMHRERLCDLLWPTFEPARAANNLRQALHQARLELQPLSLSRKYLLRNVGEHLALYPAELVVTDVAAFETAAARARRSDQPDAYWRAIALYTGRLLPAVLYEDWVESRREALASLYLALLDDVAQLHQVRGEYSRALDALQRMIAAEPSDERAVAQLMRLAAATGQRSVALKHYRALERALARELDLTPEPATQALYDAIRRGQFSPATTFTALPSAEASPAADRRSNLPNALSSFIGREQDVADVAALLADRRLVTLTGPGGTGKTRLALEVAHRRAATGVEGTWLVELAALTDPAALAQTVGSALGISTEGSDQPAEALVAALHGQTALLVLDNCEHLVDACAGLVAALLAGAPHVRVLATSRTALRLPGEQQWAVPPLALPAAGADLQALVTNDAVCLFVDRVRWHQPEFTLTQENAPKVVAICRRLEGLPLALELAAAKSALLSLPQLSTRLDDALNVLMGGSRAAPTRQQTLRATLDWSYALLSRPEQLLFRRLAVFSSGFALETAETVCAGAGVPELDVFRLLDQLVEKSQVQVQHVDGAAWYRLLEPVRQYAAELLEASGEAEEVRARLAARFVAFVEEIEPALSGPEQAAWLMRLDREHDNLRSVLGCALRRDDAETVLRLGGVLWRYWRVRWHSAEGLAWLEAGLARYGQALSPLRARAALGAGELARRLLDFDRARAFLEESLSISLELEDASGIAWAMLTLAVILGQLGDEAGMRSRAQEGLERARALGDRAGMALALNLLAEDARFAGDYARAGVLYTESLALSRAGGEQLRVAIQLHNLGYVALHDGDVPRATRSFREGHLLNQAIGYRGGELSFLEGMAAAASAGGHPAEATRFYAAFTAACAPPGREFKLHPPDQVEYDRYLGRARAALGDAAFARIWADGTALPEERVVAAALALADELAGDQPPPSPIGLASLTVREREVARFVAKHLTNHQIAIRLGLAERTVDTHVSNILRKLRLTTRGQVAGLIGNSEPT